MKVYINDQERPLLQDVLRQALSNIEGAIEAMQDDPGSWLNRRRLVGDAVLLQGLLAKLEEREASA